MDLLTPTNHADAYEWASVFLAHMAIGLGLTALVSTLLDWLADGLIGKTGEVATLLVTSVYLVVWEGFAQRYAAGLADATLDTLAVGCGGLLGLFLWRRAGAKAAGVLGVALFALWRGVRTRK
jgi:hypothetical protein